ncbi:hypothetical protein D3C78_1549570 [compost metagenome]
MESKEIVEFTDILYNIDYKETGFVVGTAGCYDPRNAILFFDKTEKLLAYIEVCFECRGYKNSSDKIDFGGFWGDKYEILRQYFIALGVQFGTIKLEDNDAKN